MALAHALQLPRMQTQPDPQAGESTSPVVYTAITAPLSLNVKWPRTCQGDNLSCAGACDRQATHINEDANGELVAMCDPCAEVMNGYKAEYLARESRKAKHQ